MKKLLILLLIFSLFSNVFKVKAAARSTAEGETKEEKQVVEVSSKEEARKKANIKLQNWLFGNLGRRGEDKLYDEISQHPWTYSFFIRTMMKKNIPFEAVTPILQFSKPKNHNFKYYHTLTGHTSGIHSVIQLKDGSLASCSRDTTIKIWQPITFERWTCSQTLTGHTQWVKSIIQLEDGNIASCSDDATIKIWKYIPKTDQWICVQTLTGHTKSFSGVDSIIQLADGSIASCSSHETKIWEWLPTLKQWICVQTLIGQANIIQLNQEKLVSYNQTEIKIWEFKSVTPDEPARWECAQTLSHRFGINSVIKLNDKCLASCSRDGTIKIWQYDAESNTWGCAITKDTGLSNHVWSLSLLMDGTIVSCSNDKRIILWEYIPSEGISPALLEDKYSFHNTEVFEESIKQLKDESLVYCTKRLSYSGPKPPHKIQIYKYKSETGKWLLDQSLQLPDFDVQYLTQLKDESLVTWSKRDNKIVIWKTKPFDIKIAD